MQTQEIDFQYSLGEHGWSTCSFTVDGKTDTMVMSHVFSNPLVDMLEVLIDLLKGRNDASFCWFDEPGGYKWDISRNKKDKEVLYIHIYWLNSEGQWSESDKVLSELEFEVGQRYFCACVYGEIAKLEELMKIESYKENRNRNYPHKYIQEYKQVYSEIYS